MTKRHPSSWAVMTLALLTSACATTSPATPEPSTSAQQRTGAVVSGRQRGLGISGDETPDALKLVALQPYALNAPFECALMAQEIAKLDDLLGPDVDVLAAKQGWGGAAEDAIGGAVRGAIPYRSVMRWMTQAGKKDRELRQAVLSGTARRAFLKGVRLGQGCPPAQP